MKKILVEIGMEFLNMIFGNVYTKTGLSLMLLLISSVLIFAPITNEPEKPKWFYIVGAILALISIFLIIKRYFELNQKLKNKEKNVAERHAEFISENTEN
ncbi:hypothetical protein [Flavobacterium sp.]|uniref:hypothetical protein n=1 Tax=Flavobacterium sp. TaxID=239 RepID=UPI00391A9567